ncbi:MAG: Ig-like domain-containing protein [Abditibacteriota bacterium]|nr:Ig-like domain-containing protein [Abditibacteriota bacterium]
MIRHTFAALVLALLLCAAAFAVVINDDSPAGSYSGKRFESHDRTESALRVNLYDPKNFTSLSITNPTVIKSGSWDKLQTSRPAAEIHTSKTPVTISNGSITSDGVNTCGVEIDQSSGGPVFLNGTTVTTSGNDSAGIYAPHSDVLFANNVRVTTYGADSPAVQGLVNVNGGSYSTKGASPAIGSTSSTFRARGAAFSASAFPVIYPDVIYGSGLFNAELTDCRLEASDPLGTVYCSGGNYPKRGWLGEVYLSMTGGKIVSGKGPLFHFAQTKKADIDLTRTTLDCGPDNDLLVCENTYGTASIIWLTARGMNFEGDIRLSGVTEAELFLEPDPLGEPTVYHGSITGDGTKDRRVHIAEGCVWVLTGDSWITQLKNRGTVDTNGHTLYINGAPYARAEALTLNKTKLTLELWEHFIFKPVFTPDNTFDQSVTWLSYDPSIVKIDEWGNAQARSLGTTTIRAKSRDGGLTAKCKVKVIPHQVPVTGISLDRSSVSLEAGNSLALSAAVKPDNATDQSVSWVSYDTSVATVDKTGKVTAVAPGTTTVRVKTKDGGYTAKCKVKVTPRQIHVTGLTLDKATATLKTGGALTLKPTVRPDDATDKTVTWVSYDTAVATVDKKGKVTAVAPGSTTIRAKTRDGGFTAKCKVKVK